MKFRLREAVFTALLLVILVGTWWFVLRPNSRRNAEMIAQIAAKQEKLRELNQATGTIGDLKGEIASLDKAIHFFQSKLPNEKEIDKVLQEVWQMAERSQLVTKSIRTLQRTGAPRDAGGPNEQPISMQLEGDYMGLYAFMQALENQRTSAMSC